MLKGLGKKISKDPYGLQNELFLFSNAGKDLVIAITKLMNHVQTNLAFPKILELCNLTNAYKNKGDRTSFDSYKGLFRTPVLRNILDKLLYVDMYETIGASLTDCNVGSRKRLNICDNLFLMNAITNGAKQQIENACDV